MKGPIFIFGLTAFIAVQAILFPHIGLIGYYGYAVLCPTWNWRWSLPDLEYQKYIVIPTLIGLFVTGFRGNRLHGAAFFAAVSILIYLSLALLSSLQSINPESSWFYMDNIWKIILMGLIGMRILDTPKKIMTCIWVIVLAQGYNAYNINELYFQVGYIQTNGFMWNYLDNNTYCLSAMPIMGLAAGLALYSAHFWQRWLAGAILCLQMHQIMILQSRGSMLAGLLVAFLTLVFMPKTFRSFSYVTISLIAAIVLAGPSVKERFNSVFKPDEELDRSADSRYDLWRAGYLITCDYPLLGVGTWSGQYLVPKYFPYNLRTSNKALHNLFFEVTTGSGIPSAIAMLLYYWLIWLAHLLLRIRYRATLPEWAQVASLGVLAGIPGFWLGSMFSSGGLIESPYVCNAIGAATLLVWSGTTSSVPTPPQAIATKTPRYDRPIDSNGSK